MTKKLTTIDPRLVLLNDVVPYHLEKLDEVLDSLTPKEKMVLELRYGLKNNNPLNLSEVGRECGVSRERIRQVEAKAIRKLKHPTRVSKIFYNLEHRQKMQSLIRENNELRQRLLLPEYQGTTLIEELPLPTRVTNALRGVYIETIHQLQNTSPEKLLTIKNLGVKGVKLIQETLEGKTYD